MSRECDLVREQRSPYVCRSLPSSLMHSGWIDKFEYHNHSDFLFLFIAHTFVQRTKLGGYAARVMPILLIDLRTRSCFWNPSWLSGCWSLLSWLLGGPSFSIKKQVFHSAVEGCGVCAWSIFWNATVWRTFAEIHDTFVTRSNLFEQLEIWRDEWLPSEGTHKAIVLGHKPDSKEMCASLGASSRRKSSQLSVVVSLQRPSINGRCHELRTKGPEEHPWRTPPSSPGASNTQLDRRGGSFSSTRSMRGWFCMSSVCQCRWWWCACISKGPFVREWCRRVTSPSPSTTWPACFILHQTSLPILLQQVQIHDTPGDNSHKSRYAK